MRGGPARHGRRGVCGVRGAHSVKISSHSSAELVVSVGRAGSALPRVLSAGQGRRWTRPRSGMAATITDHDHPLCGRARAGAPPIKPCGLARSGGSGVALGCPIGGDGQRT